LRVLFVTQYGSLAASSRTRVFQYLPYLRQQGIEVEVLTILPDDAIAGSLADVRRQPLRKIRYYLWALWRTWSTGLSVWSRGRRGDVLFIQKVIFPAPIRRLLRCLCAPIVYDFDDAIFTTEVRSGYWLSRLKEARNASGVPAMLALAKLAIVENDYTGDFARRHCDVLTITGPIDTAPYDGLTDSDPTVSDAAGAGTDGSGSDESGQAPAALIDAKQRPLVLGWIGSPSTVTYLDLIAPVLCRLARHYPLRLCVIGADFDLDGVEVECRPWSLDREAADLRACDIGLMPVPDDPWTRGKGGYKLLQYMACGLPVVAHPVGINVQIVTQGDTGFLAADEARWEQCLTQLMNDPALRRRMGNRGRVRIAADYSLESQQPRLLAALQGLREAVAA
jgi:glycosyltransferase involved in cell wall biosynthesis